MTIESDSPSQDLQALLDSLSGKTVQDVQRVFQMLANAEAVDDLAKRYRDLRIKLEQATRLRERMAIRTDPFFLAADKAAGGYPNATSESVRKLLIERYGFTEEALKGFDQYDEDSNRSLNYMFFDLFAYPSLTDDKAYAAEFTRPREGGSYIDRIVAGDREGVLQALTSARGQQGT